MGVRLRTADEWRRLGRYLKHDAQWRRFNNHGKKLYAEEQTISSPEVSPGITLDDLLRTDFAHTFSQQQSRMWQQAMYEQATMPFAFQRCTSTQSNYWATSVPTTDDEPEF